MKKNTKHISCTIKELFTAFELVNKTKIDFYLPAYVENNIIQIQNQNGEWCNITTLLKKRDRIISIITDKNKTLSAGSKHKLITNKNDLFSGDAKTMSELKHNDDVVMFDNSIEKIKSKTIGHAEYAVYDFEINSEKKWYKTPNGFIHHNTAGIGKSFSVIEELNNEEVPYVHITGGIKDAKSLYITLCKYNHKNMIVVFDDVNDILRKRDCIEILRGAVINEVERKIVYIDNRVVLDGTRMYKPMATLKNRIVIITNIPRNKIDPAIISRTSPIEITTNKNEIAEYVELNIENAPPHNVPLEWKLEVFNYLKKDIGFQNIRMFDFRVFEDCLLWRAADTTSDLWKKHIYNVLT